MKIITTPPRIAEGVASDTLMLVVSLSGGKDSTATALALREAGLQFRLVFADTGWEAAETYAHLEELEKHLGPIARVRGERQMVERMRYSAGAPTRLGRWCTQELKVRPLRAYHDALESAGQDTVSVVGIRAQESATRAKMAVFEDSDAWGGYVWRPLLDWTTEEVISIHHRHGVPLNPLYLRGHDRVGCFPCIFSNKEEIRLIADEHPERIDEIRALEAEMTAARAERNAVKPGRYEVPVATFFQPRAGQDWPTIDRVVAWSRTTRGGRQLPMMPPDPTGGCFRWGMCEPPSREEAAE